MQSLKDVGYHGFDSDTCPEMKGIFFASGPGITQDLRVKLRIDLTLSDTMLRLKLPTWKQTL
jgi:hypothetical protein